MFQMVLTIMLSYGSISAVGKRTRLPGAQTSQVVLITTESLGVGPKEKHTITRSHLLLLFAYFALNEQNVFLITPQIT